MTSASRRDDAVHSALAAEPDARRARRLRAIHVRGHDRRGPVLRSRAGRPSRRSLDGLDGDSDADATQLLALAAGAGWQARPLARSRCWGLALLRCGVLLHAGCSTPHTLPQPSPARLIPCTATRPSPPPPPPSSKPAFPLPLLASPSTIKNRARWGHGGGRHPELQFLPILPGTHFSFPATKMQIGLRKGTRYRCSRVQM